MAPSAPDRFPEALPPEARAPGRLPMTCLALTATASASPYAPHAPCAHHRARGYVCAPYHKPISRCVRVRA